MNGINALLATHHLCTHWPMLSVDYQSVDDFVVIGYTESLTKQINNSNLVKFFVCVCMNVWKDVMYAHVYIISRVEIFAFFHLYYIYIYLYIYIWTTAYHNGCNLFMQGLNLYLIHYWLPFYPRPVLAFGYCRCLRLSVCVCVRPCVNHELVRAITHDPYQLGSPNLDRKCKRPWLRSLLFLGVIDLNLQGQI